MSPYLITITTCLILGLGHVGWGIVHPVKALKESNADPVIVASYHACWYHISIIFLATAGYLGWHLMIAPIALGPLILLWGLIFACYLTYWGALIAYPQLWPIAWGQMAVIPILLISFGYGLYVDFYA